MDIGYDAQDDAASDLSTREYVIGAEIGTQTSIDFDELAHSNQCSYETEELNENIARQDLAQSFDNSTSETTKTMHDHDRPHTRIALFNEAILLQPSICMDARGIMHPYEVETADISPENILDDLGYIPCTNDLELFHEDIQIDTDDENIITAAIRKYQMPGN